MKQFAIYCTEEQTKKALELGAPITLFSNSGHIPQETADNWHLCLLGDNAYYIPKAEEMIGWLEEVKGCSFNVYEVNIGWTYNIIYKKEVDSEESYIPYESRKKATLAAIDAALEYLTNNKK